VPIHPQICRSRCALSIHVQIKSATAHEIADAAALAASTYASDPAMFAGKLSLAEAITRFKHPLPS